jgi:small neutral amino acid transporter SnatA (MarC family)
VRWRSSRSFARLGESGIHVATRVMGLILAAVAVQFVMGGLSDAGFIHTAMAPR